VWIDEVIQTSPGIDTSGYQIQVQMGTSSQAQRMHNEGHDTTMTVQPRRQRCNHHHHNITTTKTTQIQQQQPNHNNPNTTTTTQPQQPNHNNPTTTTTTQLPPRQYNWHNNTPPQHDHYDNMTTG